MEGGAEVAIAGDRPSTYAPVKAGPDADGRVTAWISRSWGSGGLGGSGSPPIPYVFDFPNRRHQHVSIPTNTASSRAWRAPNHPQACLVTMAAMEDLAAAAGTDPLDFFLKNLDRTGAREATYREQFRIGAELMEWKKKWRPRGAGKGALRRGLGLSLHTWGGRGHKSELRRLRQPRRLRRGADRLAGPRHGDAHRDRRRAGWSARPGHQSQVVLDTIICFGGFGFPTNPFVPAHPSDLWISRDGGHWQHVSDAPWNAEGPRDVKYDFDSLVVQGGPGGLRPSILTFGGDREASFVAPDPALVDDQVWRFSPPSKGNKPSAR